LLDSTVTSRDGGPRVAVVTGASRGAGRGIALALGETGATVVVTGRSVNAGDHELGGTIGETADEITRRGGRGIPIACDHADPRQVAQLFAEVEQACGGLDILVNNAFGVPDGLLGPEPFWEKPLDLLSMIDIGLRSSYVATWYAAPLLVADPGRRPLVVHTSGFGAVCYLHGPAYGAVKAGVDKLAHDMAVDFRPYRVTVVSIWMGLLRTERTLRLMASDPAQFEYSRQLTESPEFTGRVIAALDRDPAKLDFSGRVLIGAELGEQLGVRDVDGTKPRSRRPVLGDPPAYHPAVVR
jgi:NAD(P)-dependent dehydrogenase (short-subunit alcohol dehydrogenase family)